MENIEVGCEGVFYLGAAFNCAVMKHILWYTGAHIGEHAKENVINVRVYAGSTLY